MNHLNGVFQMEETVVNRPLGKIGGPLFCICLFITSLYGAVFLVGPALSLIYIWVSGSFPPKFHTFQPWLYRRVIDRIVASWLVFPIALLQKVFRVKFYASGDGFNYMERTLIVMNHRTRVDWMLFWPLLFHCARLRKLKVLLKSDLKYIPGPGWWVEDFLYRNVKNTRILTIVEISGPRKQLAFSSWSASGSAIGHTLIHYYTISTRLGSRSRLFCYSFPRAPIWPRTQKANRTSLQRTEIYRNMTLFCIPGKF